MVYKFSPSSLNLLADCPRCFWLHFRAKVRRPAGIFPSLPGGMDHKLKDYFDDYRTRGELPPELEKLGNVKLFSNMELLKPWRTNLRGIRWNDEEGNLVRGAVDELLEKDGKLIVLDFKTRGYPLKEDTAEHYRDQLDIYNFLLRKNGYVTEDYSYLLFYHPSQVNKNGEVIFNTDLVRMDVSIENAKRIIKHALEVLNGDMPQPAEGCEYCSYVDDVIKKTTQTKLQQWHNHQDDSL